MNIKAFVHLTLDLEELNYDSWRELFETHSISFAVLGHVDSSSQLTSDNNTEWNKLDSLQALNLRDYFQATSANDFEERCDFS